MNRIRTLYSLLLSLAIVVSPAHAQTWTPVNGVPNITANNPLLLTDGSVMIQDGDNSAWYKLTPDASGNYADGTWSQLASTPGWGPLYYASQVMTDGRVFAMGGEYNFGDLVWINKGGVYDPVADKWTTITAPSGWSQIGDMGSVTLPSGLIYMADPISNQAAVFNPQTNTLTAPYGSGKQDGGNDEEGLTLLPNGNLYTVDVRTTNGAEEFNTTTATWSMLPPTPYNVVDVGDQEIGPAVLMNDGKIIQFGGNGSNVVFNTATNQWITAPSFPKVGSAQLDCADAPAVLLPNGKVMVDSGPGYGGQGCYFFLWDGTALTGVTGPPDSAENVDFAGNFLLLPNGQVLFTDQSPNVMVYTPAGSPNTAWAPTITNAPFSLKLGASYVISGTQFNGLSGGSAYGDDEQNETNYPIIRLQMKLTGHVFYCKETDPSTMAICTGTQTVSTHFAVPKTGIGELGPGSLEVVTNGIASAPWTVNVIPAISASSVSLLQGTSGRGNAASVNAIDGNVYVATSISSPSGQIAAVEADYVLTESQVQSIGANAAATAKPGITEQIFAYDFVNKVWVDLANGAFGKGLTALAASTTVNANNFVGPGGLVRIAVRAIEPSHVSRAPFSLSVDLLQILFS